MRSIVTIVDLTLDEVGTNEKAVPLTDDENVASLAAFHLAEHLRRVNLLKV